MTSILVTFFRCVTVVVNKLEQSMMGEKQYFYIMYAVSKNIADVFGYKS